MNIKTKEIYSEVYQVLNLLGNEYIDKLPKSLLNMLKEKRDINYNPQYIEDIPLNKQNIKKETLAILALLHLNYWCENEKEKLELKQVLKNNEDMYQQDIRNKYNPENMFIKNKREKIVENQVSMIEYKEPLFKKIISKIKSRFHIIHESFKS